MILTSIITLMICHQTAAPETFYTSIDGMAPLMMTRGNTIQRLEAYVLREKKRLYTLNRLLKAFESEVNNETDEATHVYNPYNYFKLLKRLTSDLNFLHTITNKKTDYKRKEGLKFPKPQDLAGAAVGILRLQKMYRLNISQMANDVLTAPNNSSLPVTTASDCYELGHHLVYQAKAFTEGLLWLFEALRKCKEQCDKLDEMKIVKHISNTYFYLDDMMAAFKWRERYLNKAPVDTRIIWETVDRLHHRRQKMIDHSLNSSKPFKDEPFHALCRGEVEVPKAIEKTLQCRYLTGPHPFLHLAPVKLEQLYVRPSIQLLHDVIADDEIKQIKRAALHQKMTQSKVLLPPLKDRNASTDPIICTAKHSEDRISKSAWITPKDSPIVRTIQQRISAITGLKEGGESLQVANYGIGGHFIPHTDFFNGNSDPQDDNDKIATIMFYMSEVQGGATVFLNPGLTVRPEKGAALFWMNQHPSGAWDLATEHAACPVLQGSKWVTVVWKAESSWTRPVKRNLVQ